MKYSSLHTFEISVECSHCPGGKGQLNAPAAINTNTGGQPGPDRKGGSHCDTVPTMTVSTDKDACPLQCVLAVH